MNGDDGAFLGVGQSLTGRRWVEREADPRLGQAISQRLDLPEVVGRVLAGRGLTPETAPDFLNPRLSAALPDPNVMADMEKAAGRIAAGIQAGEEVAVFGDYDVDGATSSALLKRFFDAAGGRLRIYIPDRLAEGYGPNAPALLKLAADGVSLVITVDCGVMAFRPLAAAAEAGLDVIVADHHQAETLLPESYAVVNPNRLDDDSGLGQLAAVGVVFMLVVAVNRVLRQAGWYGEDRPEPDLRAWLDLVALGTVCDVVPLTGLNRAFVAQGLKVMGRRRNPGLAALADVARMDSAPGTYHAGFLLGPRVNAGGRVGEAGLGARLLSSDAESDVKEIAAHLDALNAERQAIEAEVEAAALEQVLSEAGVSGDPGPVVFAAGPGWHPGVIGIVAGRLKDRFQRPAVVVAIGDNEAKGSARSIPGVNVGAAMIAAIDDGLLVNGGGHAMAAGLTADPNKLGWLKDFLNERLVEDVAAARAGAALKLDGAVSVAGASVDLVAAVGAVAPFGVGNPEPRFAIPDVRLVAADVVGKNHVRCFFAGGEGGRLKGIAFRAADGVLGETLLTGVGRGFHIAGKLKIDEWKAERRTEMVLDDAAFAETGV